MTPELGRILLLVGAALGGGSPLSGAGHVSLREQIYIRLVPNRRPGRATILLNPFWRR